MIGRDKIADMVGLKAVLKTSGSDVWTGVDGNKVTKSGEAICRKLLNLQHPLRNVVDQAITDAIRVNEEERTLLQQQEKKEAMKQVFEDEHEDTSEELPVIKGHALESPGEIQRESNREEIDDKPVDTRE